MRRAEIIAMLAAVVALTTWTSHAAGQEQVRLTVPQLFRSNHQIVIVAGTEVVWADPHFDRVSFPAGSGTPRVDRGPEGYRAVFTRPGTYRGTFTVVAGHATNDVYQLTVTVREAPK